MIGNALPANCIECGNNKFAISFFYEKESFEITADVDFFFDLPEVTDETDIVSAICCNCGKDNARLLKRS